MEYIGRFISNFRELYNGINAATLTGAIDVVIVQQEDGTFLSSPFHVRFGKLGVLRSREKVVDIEINGDPVDIHMKLGESGEAFFVSEAMDGLTMPYHLATSPIPPPLDQDPARIVRSQSLQNKSADDNTLMGSRDDGLLDSEHDIVLGSNPAGVERTFKPIELPDQVEIPPQDMTEEERKRWRKKSRKKRSQMRRKMREAVKVSSESSGEVCNLPMDEDVEEDDDSPPAGVTPETAESQMGSKLGHRKSHSFAGVPLNSPQPKVIQPTVSSDWTGTIISRSIGPEFHFFSDTEMEIKSPDGSRPPTPFHSDTEYEVGQHQERSKTLSQLEDASGQCPRQSWRWGELPSPPVPIARTSPPKSGSIPVSRDVSPSKISADGSASRVIESASRPAQTPEEKEAQRSMVSHMFSFMRQTKKMRSQAASAAGGIYLDDLNADALDPELAALYITQSSFRQGLHDSSATNFSSRLRDEDAESGKGLSLPQSPNSLSSVATVTRGGGSSSGPRSVDSDFEDSRSSHHNDNYHHHRSAVPLDVSLSLCGNFGSPDGSHIEVPEELFLQSLVTYDDFAENPRIIENPDLIVKIGSKYYSWQAACPIIMSWALYQRVLPQSTVDTIIQEYGSKTAKPSTTKKTAAGEAVPAATAVPATRSSSWFPWRRSQQKADGQTPPSSAEPLSSVSISNNKESSAGSVSSGAPTGDLPTTGTSSDNESNDSSNVVDGSKKLPLERRSYYENTDVFCKTLRLTSEQIEMLHLREGPNEAVFSVTTAYQGTTRCKCHIYLWRYDDRVVISDIDGTITKSDVLGHILPIVGQDWAQSGVAQLFTKIKNNGYRILYLSARAIGQAHITREYLRSVRQGDLSLPDGPLLLNPTSLLSAFHREVIEKKPEEFKISCLKDIQALFPTQSNPFYAGYGNRVNDVWAYRAVGIPTSRIFTINPRGELKLELTQSFQSSYSKQSFIVDLVFPPFTHGAQNEVLEGVDYNEFTYWRTPVPEALEEVDQFLTAYAADTTGRKRRLTPAPPPPAIEQKMK